MRGEWVCQGNFLSSHNVNAPVLNIKCSKWVGIFFDGYLLKKDFLNI